MQKDHSLRLPSTFPLQTTESYPPVLPEPCKVQSVPWVQLCARSWRSLVTSPRRTEQERWLGETRSSFTSHPSTHPCDLDPTPCFVSRARYCGHLSKLSRVYLSPLSELVRRPLPPHSAQPHSPPDSRRSHWLPAGGSLIETGIGPQYLCSGCGGYT